MGGKSKSKGSSGSSYRPVSQSTQAGASRALDGLMEKQSGFLGKMLGPLVEHGQAMMANNPGLQNFVSKVGTAPGQKQFDDLGLLLGLKRPEDEEATASPAATPANPSGLTDEQIAQLQRSGFGYGNFNINTPYNINNDMRNRFNR